jgi:hypothetical protein
MWQREREKSTLACQALNPGHPAGRQPLPKPLCNQLVCTKIKLTLQILLGILTIKFDEVLWQSSVQFEQSGQTIHEQ